jgi:hypothetical protein
MANDQPEATRRDYLFLHPQRWEYLSAFAYACYLYIGRGAVLINLASQTIDYVMQTPPGKRSILPREMQAEIEKYDPAAELVCALVSTRGRGIDLTYDRYRIDYSSPWRNYYAAAEMLGQKKPFEVMHLAGLYLRSCFRGTATAA